MRGRCRAVLAPGNGLRKTPPLLARGANRPGHVRRMPHPAPTPRPLPAVRSALRLTDPFSIRNQEVLRQAVRLDRLSLGERGRLQSVQQSQARLGRHEPQERPSHGRSAAGCGAAASFSNSPTPPCGIAARSAASPGQTEQSRRSGRSTGGGIAARRQQGVLTEQVAGLQDSRVISRVPSSRRMRTRPVVRR